MPPRKREGNDADSFTAQAASTPAKRQRVSLACDSCRTAREKCDGARPHCGTCTAQNRPCSYTPASRKRGVQTGYLRSIELSLAWLFEQVPGCEGALHRLLTQNDGADGARILATKDKAGHRLYRRWSKSRVHKDIGRLLSDEKTPRTDTSAEDSETEEGISPANAFLLDLKNSPDFGLPGAGPSLDNSTTSYAVRHVPISPESPRLVLPSNWERLVDIYFTYTHCWFPIIERDTIISTAMRYSPEGLKLDPKHSTALHAQLWAVLAIASFQDSVSRPLDDNPFSLNYILDISRRLTPPEDGNFETPHICAILIQSLVLLGQRNHMAAWLLIGKSLRLALGAQTASAHMFPVRQGSHPSLNDPGKRILAAAFMLDTLVSLCLGQPEVTAGLRSRLPSDTFAGLVDPEELWSPIPGVGPTPGATAAPSRTSAQPLPTFRQLYAFCKLWATSMDERMHDSSTLLRRITPEDLVKSLDPRFSFCNSLIFGDSTPTVPSAFLLQGMFLTVTLDLVPGHRPSLFSNLLEVVESCLDNFGPSGTPLLMITLMEIVRQHGHNERMHEHDKTRWEVAMDTLQGVWNPSLPRGDGLEGHQNTTTRVGNATQPIPGPPYVEELSTATYHATHRPSSISETETQELTRLPQQKDQQPLLSYERHRFPANSDASPGPSQSIYAVTPNMTFQSPPLSGGHTIPIFQNAGMAGQLVDYDAILEELGSIDCADSIDVDPQFMTNLGFAPGCDLGEMFQGDFGT